MTAVTKKRANTFSEKAKKALTPGQEISENGIIYRKRKDGFGTWRYDFTQSGNRHKGVIGSDRDGVTLSQARDVASEIRAKAITDRMRIAPVAPHNPAACSERSPKSTWIGAKPITKTTGTTSAEWTITCYPVLANAAWVTLPQR